MIQGQMLDISSEGRNLSIAELESMHQLKTGALITASLRCGAIIGGAGKHQAASLESYAKNIGLAFQVADDILNVEGDPDLMGKATGTDQASRKKHLPFYSGFERFKTTRKKISA